MAAIVKPTFNATYELAEAAICNMALSRIGATLMKDTAEVSKGADACRENYALTRDEMLRYIAPRFAQATALIPEIADPDYPLNGYEYAYDLSDLSILRLVMVGAKEDAVYELVNDSDGHTVLLTSEPQEENGYVQIKYIKAVKNPAEFDVMFKEALVVNLAHNISYGLVQSSLILGKLEEEAARKAYQAKVASLSEAQYDPNDALWTDRGTDV